VSNLVRDHCHPMASVDIANRKCCGIFIRKERWGLSRRGWLGMFLVLALIASVWVLTIQPFLASTQRVDSKVLVVEGWVQPFTFHGAVKEFRDHNYQQIYTTGGPVVGGGGYINDFNTSASVGAEALVKAGLAASVVQMVPSHVAGRDRTYSSALALREYFRTNGMTVKRFNVLTEDVHARRTWLLFQEAFGKDVDVGIIAVPDPDYDPQHWWRYSEGVREILGESIAYIYAKFLFWPSNQTEEK
jgi:hypothetical protein